MKGIDTSLAVRSKFVDAVCDPSGSVSGDHLNTGQLFVRKQLIELSEDGFPVALTNPDYGIGIVVDDDRDVLVPLLVAGLVNSNVDKTIKASGTFRLEVIEAPRYAFPDGFLVDAHIV